MALPHKHHIHIDYKFHVVDCHSLTIKLFYLTKEQIRGIDTN